MAVAPSSLVSSIEAGEALCKTGYPPAFGWWNLAHSNYKTIKISIFSLPEAES